MNFWQWFLSLFAQPAPPAPPPPPPVRSIWYEGDSTHHGGYNVTQRLGIPPAQHIRNSTGWLVHDMTQNGQSATMRYHAMAVQGVQFQADIVLLGFGWNDLALSADLYTVLVALVQLVRVQGKTPVIIGMSFAPNPRYTEYNDQARRAASDYSVPFVDWGNVYCDPNVDLADGLHPNQPFSLRLTDETIRILRSIP